MKIVILERNSVGTDIDVDRFKDFGEVICYPVTVTPEETAERIIDADIVIANKVPMNASTLDGAKNLKLICEFATGFDNVDLDYCRNRNILVANVRNYSTAAVAQHTFALALYLLEKIYYYDVYVKSGVYGNQPRFSNFDKSFTELDGKTWGIIGMGNIGKMVARIATAYGCKVIFYSASGKSTCTDYEQVDFDTLLSQSDVLSLHCPLTDRTKNIIDLSAMKKMKPSSIIINVARGPVVNNHDLYTALTDNIIAAAGLDVLEKEPITQDNPLSKFFDSTRLLITPHMAWASVEARERCVSETYKNIKSFIEGNPRNIVNN